MLLVHAPAHLWLGLAHHVGDEALKQRESVCLGQAERCFLMNSVEALCCRAGGQAAAQWRQERRRACCRCRHMERRYTVVLHVTRATAATAASQHYNPAKSRLSVASHAMFSESLAPAVCTTATSPTAMPSSAPGMSSSRLSPT